MTIEPIITALVDMIVFLGLSGEEAVNEDAATAQLENTAAILRELDDDAKQAFVRCTQKMANCDQVTFADSERSRFMRDMPAYLGLEAG